MNIIAKQNGGYTNCVSKEDPNIIYLERRRSYIISIIDHELYVLLKNNVGKLKFGDGDIRSGSIILRVFEPNDFSDFNDEILTMHDFEFPTQIICHSTLFTSDLIKDYPLIGNYRMMAIDLIWCRENVLFERLNKLIPIFNE